MEKNNTSNTTQSSKDTTNTTKTTTPSGANAIKQKLQDVSKNHLVKFTISQKTFFHF